MESKDKWDVDRIRGEMVVNPLPWTVWVLVLPMILIEAVLSIGEAGLLGQATGAGWRSQAIRAFSVWPPYWVQQWDWGVYPLDLVRRFFTYSFVHADPSHLLFAAVIVMATGKFVGDAMRPSVLIVLFFGAAAGGGLIYAAFSGNSELLIGAYPGAYGLIGGLSHVLWQRSSGPLRDRLQSFRLIGALLVLQILFSLIFGGGTGWKSEVPAFVIGFLLTIGLDRIGLLKTLRRLRQR
jgi:membrane associated rhomboid family serine protease